MVVARIKKRQSIQVNLNHADSPNNVPVRFCTMTDRCPCALDKFDHEVDRNIDRVTFRPAARRKNLTQLQLVWAYKGSNPGKAETGTIAMLATSRPRRGRRKQARRLLPSAPLGCALAVAAAARANRSTVSGSLFRNHPAVEPSTARPSSVTIEPHRSHTTFVSPCRAPVHGLG